MQAFEATNFYFDQAARLLDLTDNMRTLVMSLATVEGLRFIASGNYVLRSPS